MKIKTVHTRQYIDLIDYLIKLRKETSINQKNMAIALNLNQTDISKIESRERRIDISETFKWLHKCKPYDKKIILEAYNIFIETMNDERI